MYYGHPWGMNYGFMGAMSGVFSFVLWVIIFVVIFKVIRHVRRGGHWHKIWGEKDAMEILRERYAKGEINNEEFEEKKKNLQK